MLVEARRLIPKEIPITTADTRRSFLDHPELPSRSSTSSTSTTTRTGTVSPSTRPFRPSRHGTTPCASTPRASPSWSPRRAGRPMGMPWGRRSRIRRTRRASSWSSSRARLNDVRYTYFSPLDEPWKEKYEGPQGAHWGYRDRDGVLKPGMQAVFDGIATDIGEPQIEFTSVPPRGSEANLVGVSGIGTLTHHVAVLLEVGGLWYTKPSYLAPTVRISSTGRFEVDDDRCRRSRGDPLRGLPVRGGLRPGTGGQREEDPGGVLVRGHRERGGGPMIRLLAAGSRWQRSVRPGGSSPSASSRRTRSRLRNSRSSRSRSRTRSPRRAPLKDLYECWLGDEIVLARAPALGRDSLPRFAEEPGIPKFKNIELADGRRARAVAVRYLPPRPERPDPLRSSLVPDLRAPVSSPGAHPVEVIVAQPEEELESILRQLRLLIAVSWIVTSVLSAAGLTWVVRRGLSPLEDLGDQIQSKGESELDQPFSLPGASIELAPVIDRLNGFRERVGSAIEREHDFAAHAAHELRTPLAGLRSTLEVSLSRERSRRVPRERADRLKITTQLERLVGRLLELARSASPSAVVRPERFELRQLALESWTPYSDAAAERGSCSRISIDPASRSRAIASSSAESSRTSSRTSAITRTRAPWRASRRRRGGAGRRDRRERLRRLDEELVRHAFDAFWRSDDARTAVGRHAGLGLALCQQLVELLSGTITASGDSGRFCVTIVLPRDSFTTPSLGESEGLKGPVITTRAPAERANVEGCGRARSAPIDPSRRRARAASHVRIPRPRTATCRPFS